MSDEALNAHLDRMANNYKMRGAVAPWIWLSDKAPDWVNAELAQEKEQLEAGNEQHKRAWVGLKDLCDRASEYDWPTGYMYIGNVRQALDFAILAAEEEDDGPPTVLTSEGLETTAGQWEKG